MALEYDLYFKGRPSLPEKIENILTSKKVNFKKDHAEGLVCFDLYNFLGFVLTIFIRDNKYFNYLISETQTKENEWKKTSVVSFRLNKDYNYLGARLNMLDIVVYILKESDEDVILLFNSDVMILEREGGKIVLNKAAGFWSSKDLLDKIGSAL